MKKEQEPEPVSQPKVEDNKLPAIGGGGLPSIGNRGGNFMIDADYMKKATRELNKLNDIADMDASKKPEQPTDNRSMAEVLKAKREATEAQLEESKEKSKVETMEERKARLMAQRDAIRKAKQQQMQEELTQFNEKTKTKDSLFEELKKMD